MNVQPKAISEVVKDFEQSLGNLRPSTRRVYVAGARAAIRAARLELCQRPSNYWHHSENPPSVEDFQLYQDMRRWHLDVGNMLSYINDKLSPHGWTTL